MTILPMAAELAQLKTLLALAKQEDLGPGDITSKLLGSDTIAAGRFVAREDIICCGAVFLPIIAGAYSNDISTAITCPEGTLLNASQPLATWQGPGGPLLAAERVALNFIQHLSGIATLTKKYVDAVTGTKAKIYDTRKTTPAWRELEKYAVRAGGGFNHRRGLYDAILIKDNHLAAMTCTGDCSSDPITAIGKTLARGRANLPLGGFIEMEVDTLTQLELALKLDLDVILLDNMSASELTQAVKMRNEAGKKGIVALEASGAITLDTVRPAALAGVDRIAIGAITHSARCVDIGLDATATVNK